MIFWSEGTVLLGRSLVVCLAFLLMGLCPGVSGTALARDDDGIAYRARLEGVDDRALADLLRATSQVFTLRRQRPLSVAALRRRAQSDIERLETALKSEGYYRGRVTPIIDTDKNRVTVTLQVETGPAFPIRSLTVELADDPMPQGAENLPVDGQALGLPPGDIAKGAAILGAQGRAVAAARRLGFAFVRVQDRRVVVDLRDAQVDVTIVLALGQRVRFGDLVITGLERVDRQFVEEYRPWEADTLYAPDLVTSFAQRLQGTGLFRAVQVRAADAAGPDGRLPILIDLSERKRRTVGGGFEFATNTGPGASLFWEHRNLAGRGQKLRADLEFADIRQALRLTYEQPRFRRFNQAFRASIGVALDETEAFEATTVTAAVGVERRRTANLTLGARVEAEYAETQDAGVETDSYLAALPIFVRWDTTDDLLNPTRGQRATITVTPAVGVNDDFIAFLTNDVRASTYHALGEKDRWVLAGRLRYATITGEETASIPAGRRLFAGGGGSVRPIEFQFAGPLDPDGGPAGGRSAVEIGGEVRVRATRDIGIAPFVEGGSVFDESFPSFSETILWGGGLGAWYVTPVGPFRFDVAVPFNPRPGIDDDFQVYVSLGQPF